MSPINIVMIGNEIVYENIDVVDSIFIVREILNRARKSGCHKTLSHSGDKLSMFILIFFLRHVESKENRFISIF